MASSGVFGRCNAVRAGGGNTQLKWLVSGPADRLSNRVYTAQIRPFDQPPK